MESLIGSDAVVHPPSDMGGRSSASFAEKLMILFVSLNAPSFHSCKVDVDCIGSMSYCLTTLVFLHFVNFALNLKPTRCCKADGSKALAY